MNNSSVFGASLSKAEADNLNGGSIREQFRFWFWL